MLARELLPQLHRDGKYSAETWLDEMIAFMTTPGKHTDTYVEEYLRGYFINLSKKFPREKCGRKNEKHIGSFGLLLPLFLALARDPDQARKVSLQHLALPHGGELMRSWGEYVSTLLLDLLEGKTVSEAMATAGHQSKQEITAAQLQGVQNYPDTTVVAMHFSSACYVDVAVPATLLLALKYQNLPEDGLIANTMCGGDNCGRGSVLGALFGAMHGMKGWPVAGLKAIGAACFCPDKYRLDLMPKEAITKKNEQPRRGLSIYKISVKRNPIPILLTYLS